MTVTLLLMALIIFPKSLHSHWKQKPVRIELSSFCIASTVLLVYARHDISDQRTHCRSFCVLLLWRSFGTTSGEISHLLFACITQSQLQKWKHFFSITQAYAWHVLEWGTCKTAWKTSTGLDFMFGGAVAGYWTAEEEKLRLWQRKVAEQVAQALCMLSTSPKSLKNGIW